MWFIAIEFSTTYAVYYRRVTYRLENNKYLLAPYELLAGLRLDR